MRKIPTCWTSLFEAGQEYGEGEISSSNDTKFYESSASPASWWFLIFILGTKRCMGVVRKQDGALAVNQLMVICVIT